jgi:hypothetical protein
VSHLVRQPSPLLRWTSVALRGIHLATVIGLGAALLGAQLSIDQQAIGVLVSGILMFALDLSNKPHMLFEWSGLALVIKLAAVVWLALDEGMREVLFWGIVVWSVLFAHAPAYFRHARWRG